MQSEHYNTGLKKSIFFLFALLFTANLTVNAQNIRVAAAANLQPVMEVLQKDFKQKTFGGPGSRNRLCCGTTADSFATTPHILDSFIH